MHNIHIDLHTTMIMQFGNNDMVVHTISERVCLWCESVSHAIRVYMLDAVINIGLWDDHMYMLNCKFRIRVHSFLTWDERYYSFWLLLEMF